MFGFLGCGEVCVLGRGFLIGALRFRSFDDACGIIEVMVVEMKRGAGLVGYFALVIMAKEERRSENCQWDL